MRVLIYSELYRPYIGGVEVLLARLLPRLRQAGYDLRVVTSHDWERLPDREKVDGITVLRLPIRAAVAERDFASLGRTRARLLRELEGFAPDLLHVHGVGTGLLLLQGVLRSVPRVLTLHNVLKPAMGREGALVAGSLRAAAWVTAVSRAVRGSLLAALPALAERSSVIHNGLEVPPRPRWPRGPTLRVLCIGRCIEQKGFDLAIAALPPLLRRWPQLTLTVVGDGPDRTALERRARELGVHSAVRFLGFQEPERIGRLLDGGHAVLMPSRWEGLPMVAVEAALHARPVVATRVGGLPEVIADGETGWLVPPESSAALAGALERLLEDRARAREMGAAARRRALELFTLERCAGSYDALYRRLAGAGVA